MYERCITLPGIHRLHVTKKFIWARYFLAILVGAVEHRTNQDQQDKQYPFETQNKKVYLGSLLSGHLGRRGTPPRQPRWPVDLALFLASVKDCWYSITKRNPLKTHYHPPFGAGIRRDEQGFLGSLYEPLLRCILSKVDNSEWGVHERVLKML